MAIVFKHLKNKTIVTSSFFEDVRMMKKTYQDEELRNMRWSNSPKGDQEYYKQNFGKIKLAATVQMITLWKQGCRELTAWVESLTEKQIQEHNYETKYMGEVWKPYESLDPENPEDLKEIQAIDRFVEQQMAALHADEAANA